MTVGRGGGEVATNTAVGASALAANTTGVQQTAIGASAGASITTNSYLSAVGYQAGYYMTDSNDAFGRQALYGQSGATGYYNCGFGNRTLYSLTTGNVNVAVGTFALQNNTTGSSNFAGGYQALNGNTTASNNTAVGYQAGYSGTTGGSNAFFGYRSGYSVTTGQYNIAIGQDAGRNNISSNNNTFVGVEAGYSTTGSANTFIGRSSAGAGNYGAGYNVTTGSNNTIIGGYNGNQGGLDIRTSSNRIVLSDGDGNPRGVFSNDGELYVGITTKAGGVANAWYQATTTDSKSAIAVSAHVNGANAINWYNASSSYLGSITLNASTVTYGGTSDYRLKENVAPMINALAKVQALKPCTFTWKNSGEDGDGFLAHELQEVCPNAVSGEKDAVNEDGSIRPQQVDTSYVVATLTAAIQELKAEFDAYKATHP
jgi:hypothetical protein